MTELAIKLKNDLCCENAHVVLRAAHTVRDLIFQKEILVELNSDIELIEEKVKGLDFGGAILPNSRFISKAINIIKDSVTDKCLCEYAFDDFGLCAKSMTRYGFILLSDKTEGYVNTGEIECPLCHQKYMIEEKYTGGHVTSTKHYKIR